MEKKAKDFYFEELQKELRIFESCDFDFLHMAIVDRIKKMYLLYAQSAPTHNTESTNIQIAAELKHLLDINDSINNLRESNTYTSKREKTLFKMFYEYLGSHITNWHDFAG